MPNEHCRHFIDFVPFLGMMTGGVQNTPLVTRLSEAAIIAAVSTGIALFAGVKVVESEVDNTKTQLNQIEANIERNMGRMERTIERSIQDLDRKINRVDGRVESMYRDIYAPRGVGKDGSM